ncbi:MuDR family transposase [Striga hermonthica]|uniref:MuDR family transposase n=1 Tax=Striga hermonthica TaxID=68872 RepID=A0A9N7RR89_STRHE|nr:MuDR family transposase [Striga hermonthica]
MSDRQKGLVDAVNRFFPGSEHRYCVMHLYSNFKQNYRGLALKGILFKAAMSSRVVDLQKATIVKILEELKKRASDFFAHWNGEDQFEIENGIGTRFKVHLTEKTCTCRRWDLTGIPCVHAISGIFYLGKNPEDFVDNCYSRNTFLRSHSHMMKAINDSEMWPEVDVQSLVPPVIEKMPGRPRKHNRRKDPDEGKRDSGRPSQGGRPLTLGKKGVKMTCSYCGQKNHNVRGCPSKKNENNQKEKEKDEQTGVTMNNEPNGNSQASASVGPQQMGHASVGPQQMGPQRMGPQQMGPASEGPNQMSPASVNPDQMGPQQMGPDQMGPQQMGPDQMGSQQMDPDQMDIDPGLEEIYSVIDEFDASLPNNEQPLARPPQRNVRNTSEIKNAMKTTQIEKRIIRSASTSIEKSQTLIKNTREVSTKKELAKSITVTGPTTRSNKNINSTSATNSKASKSIDKVTGNEKIVHTQNSQTTKDVQSTKRTLGLKRKLDVRKMPQSQGQTSNSAHEVDKPIWRPPGRSLTDARSFSRMFGGGFMISGGGIVHRPDPSIVRSEGTERRSEGTVTRSAGIVRSEEETPVCRQQ